MKKIKIKVGKFIDLCPLNVPIILPSFPRFHWILVACARARSEYNLENHIRGCHGVRRWREPSSKEPIVKTSCPVKKLQRGWNYLKKRKTEIVLPVKINKIPSTKVLSKSNTYFRWYERRKVNALEITFLAKIAFYRS